MKLKDFEKLTNAATPGPWKTSDMPMFPNMNGVWFVQLCDNLSIASPYPDSADVRFITACRDMVPKMIKRLQLAERIIDSVDGHPFLKDDLVMSMFVREYRETEMEQP